ncbi:serine/threonine-protein kinase RsbT [Scopulibacillus darangshiensis]|uniref:Serine/threonine-protein kinase RsbT n=1 Tax=Scopulibacillus darangshiensis TaxID=442528 RepID=A0A4R2NR17_9BACL|nr:anti-sigma regulatory factor [Scopulibacillus darangshiensis]TCP23828.1 serine/threonine-protein kinase RsbT [Scopulibacillus darangshiensis]
METQASVKIRNEWDIVQARQLGRELSKEMGFGQVDQARITTAISELARNIYLYAQNGEIDVEAFGKVGRIGLKIISTDQGPGISDIRLVMQDGYTTSGGLGAGLPGVKRLMDDFKIHSQEGRGTEIVAIKWLR